ncbi:MAG: dihydrofolate reductase, partial [Actinobacteria bacterium]|nr:dihydrofolate reductase [Actinomycetota bacterium]
MAVTGRALVPWKEVRDDVADLGLDVEIFTGEAPGPADLDDVVFFTVPYDQPFGAQPLGRLPRVQVVQALTAGYDHLLARLPDGAVLCNGRGLHDASTA